MALAAGLGTLALLAGLAFAALGPERAWGVFGPADLGAVDFARLQRRNSPNDALAAPAGLAGSARTDFATPVFALDAPALRDAMARALAAEESLQRVDADARAGTERYVQRTRLLGFPDTIDVLYVDLPDGRSTLALYSRSRIGYGDLGANRARLERWLARLTSVAPVAR
ncbi:MAG: DUF1499 domain-containing protein [Alphaproteobacteria bacterium]